MSYGVIWKQWKKKTKGNGFYLYMAFTQHNYPLKFQNLSDPIKCNWMQLIISKKRLTDAYSLPTYA